MTDLFWLSGAQLERIQPYFPLSHGQMSDHKGAQLMLPALPCAKSLTGDKGYDSNAFRKAGHRALYPAEKEPQAPPDRRIHL